MGFFWKLTKDFISHTPGRTACQNDTRLLLKSRQFIVKPVIIIIAHDLVFTLIIHSGCFVELLY